MFGFLIDVLIRLILCFIAIAVLFFIVSVIILSIGEKYKWW